jgi:hypothetical protein
LIDEGASISSFPSIAWQALGYPHLARLCRICYLLTEYVSSASYDLDLVVDMVISSIRFLELDLFTPATTLDMVSFESVSLPSSEHLLEAMTEFCLLT